MITIISGTHRKDNLTITFSNYYLNSIKQKGEEVQLLDLRTLPSGFFQDNSIFGTTSEEVDKLLKTYFVSAEKFIFVLPEYNGSFPGIVKMLIDSIEPSVFKGKKAALVGISSGRAGNLRGMEHFTGILHYLDVHVLPYKLPISRIFTLMDDSKTIVDDETLRVMELQIEKFIRF
ncbi:MAG: NAD(P)H-dependent oxidoreductase [Flavobacteriales bacterium]|nr:NAD(P)H-dependent oxidoreductase [Flavobacteriales bacterium]